MASDIDRVGGEGSSGVGFGGLHHPVHPHFKTVQGAVAAHRDHVPDRGGEGRGGNRAPQAAAVGIAFLQGIEGAAESQGGQGVSREAAVENVGAGRLPPIGLEHDVINPAARGGDTGGNGGARFIIAVKTHRRLAVGGGTGAEGWRRGPRGSILGNPVVRRGVRPSRDRGAIGQAGEVPGAVTAHQIGRHRQGIGGRSGAQRRVAGSPGGIHKCRILPVGRRCRISVAVFPRVAHNDVIAGHRSGGWEILPARGAAQLGTRHPRRRPVRGLGFVASCQGGSTAIRAHRPVAAIVVAQLIHDAPVQIPDAQGFATVVQRAREGPDRPGDQGRTGRDQEIPVSGDEGAHSGGGEGVINPPGDSPAGRVHIHPVKVAQFNPFGLTGRWMILHFVEDHDGIQSAGRAGTEDSQEKEG